jgi:hypothetical protein
MGKYLGEEEDAKKEEFRNSSSNPMIWRDSLLSGSHDPGDDGKYCERSNARDSKWKIVRNRKKEKDDIYRQRP